MNPRAKAKQIYEAVAIAIQKREDPIAPIEMALWQIRQETLTETSKKCLEIQGDGVGHEIQAYNSGCEDCSRAIDYLKGKIEF